MRECLIVRDYRPQYAAPISVTRDAYVVVHREDANYPGWWWCTAPDGRSGWMPLELLEGWRGWLFVENEQGAWGWILATVAV